MAVDLKDISETELKARGIDWVVCWEIRGRDESVRLKFFFRHGSVLRHFWMEYFHKKFVMPINDIVHLSSLFLPPLSLPFSFSFSPKSTSEVKYPFVKWVW